MSTWVYRYSSLLQRSVPLGQRGHVAMVGRILCTKCTLHSNYRLPRVIFQHTKGFLPRSGRFITHTLASPSGRNVNYDEKQLSGGKKFLSCSFYLYRFRKYVSHGSPIINFCNPGVHYETSCIILDHLKVHVRFNQETRSTYNVTLRRVRVTIIAVEKQ